MTLPTETAYVAMAEGVTEAMYVREIMVLLRPESESPSNAVFENNMGAKAFDRGFPEFLSQQAQQARWCSSPLSSRHGGWRRHHVGGKEQFADIRTKTLDRKHFEARRHVLLGLRIFMLDLCFLVEFL